MRRCAMVVFVVVFSGCVVPDDPPTTPRPGARAGARGGVKQASLGDGVRVVFMEPMGNHKVKMPTYRVVSDKKKIATLRRYMNNQPARLALELFRLAHDVNALQTPGGAKRHPFYIALVPGGNHAAGGFKLVTGGGTENKTNVPYIKLGFRKKRFRTTLLHETGHVILGILSGGRGVPTEHVEALPHSTAAITNRGTAFNEGFAIHLETLAAHYARDPELRRYYQHREPEGGRRFLFQTHYFFPVRDVMTYAQNFARYVDVRDNMFCFQTAITRGSYYRIQLDRSRNLARLRNPNQLLASEGFHATYFFRLATRSLRKLDRNTLGEAYGPIFTALWKMLRRVGPKPIPAYLPEFLNALKPDGGTFRKKAYTLLFDLSHGVFFLKDAQPIWDRLYRAALKIDFPMIKKNATALARKRKNTVATCLADADCFKPFVGPVLKVTVKGVTVRMPRLMGGRPMPLSFDLNTVQPGVLHLVPDIKDFEIQGFIQARRQGSFRTGADAAARTGLSATGLQRLGLKSLPPAAPPRTP